jgi:hypothetical protein
MILKVSATFIVGRIKSLVYRVKWERNINIILCLCVCVCVFVCVFCVTQAQELREILNLCEILFSLIFFAVLW